MTENVRTPLLPIFITLITLPIGFGFQTYQLFQEQNNGSSWKSVGEFACWLDFREHGCENFQS